MRAPKMIFPPVLAPPILFSLFRSGNNVIGAKTGGKIIFGARMSTASRCQIAAVDIQPGLVVFSRGGACVSCLSFLNSYHK